MAKLESISGRTQLSLSHSEALNIVKELADALLISGQGSHHRNFVIPCIEVISGHDSPSSLTLVVRALSAQEGE